jgi:hypothetical protein
MLDKAPEFEPTHRLTHRLKMRRLKAMRKELDRVAASFSKLSDSAPLIRPERDWR